MNVRSKFISDLNAISPEIAAWADNLLTKGATLDEVKDRLAGLMKAARPGPQSLYSRTHQAWADHMKTLPEGTNPWEAPPHLQKGESVPRQLDVELSKALRPHVEQWEEGLISATEFVDKIIFEAFK